MRKDRSENCPGRCMELSCRSGGWDGGWWLRGRSRTSLAWTEYGRTWAATCLVCLLVSRRSPPSLPHYSTQILQIISIFTIQARQPPPHPRQRSTALLLPRGRGHRGSCPTLQAPGRRSCPCLLPVPRKTWREERWRRCQLEPRLRAERRHSHKVLLHQHIAFRHDALEPITTLERVHMRARDSNHLPGETPSENLHVL